MDASQKNSRNVNPQTGRVSITEVFDAELAVLLGNKICSVYPDFKKDAFVEEIKTGVAGKSYTERITFFAQALHANLPASFPAALAILEQILGPENTEQTGMFTNFYWLLPVGKFVQLFGIDYFEESMSAIAEITKRNTGEYAIRPFANRYPEKTLAQCKKWATSQNFHLRRLASEGLRPKLPWAPKLDVWNNNPKPIFEILELLKEDEILFVKKSVANHLRDWIKVNPKEAERVVKQWSTSPNHNTKWILKHAQR